MKRTSILLSIGLAFLLILVGCANNGPVPEIPSNVEIRQSEDFVDGEAYTSSKFTVWVKYLYSSDYVQIEDAELKFNGSNGIVTFGDTVSVTVGTDVSGRPVTTTKTINVVAKAAVITSIASVDATGFKIPKFDYTTLADLPEIDASKVNVSVGFNNESAGAEVAANTIDGIELSYCFQETGELLVEGTEYENLKFATGSYNNNLGIIAVVGDLSAKTAVAVGTETVAVTGVYSGTVVAGTPVADIDLNNLSVYVKVGSTGENQKVSNSDVKVEFVNASGNTTQTEAKMNDLYLRLTYKGVTTATGSLTKVTVIEAPVVYTIKSVKFNETALELFKMDYTTAPSITAATALTEVVITKDGEDQTPVTSTFTDIEVGYYTAKDLESAIEAGTTDFSEYDNVYVGVTYSVDDDVVASYFEEVELSEPVIESIALEAEYQKKNSTSNAMFNSEITWTLSVTPEDGKAFEVDPANAEYWIDGQPAKYADVLKKVNGKTPAVLAVYGGKESSVVNVEAGAAYVNPDYVKVDVTDDLKAAAWVGDTYNKQTTGVVVENNIKKYFKLTIDEKNAYVGGTPATPTIESVKAPSSVAVLNETGNYVTVTVKFIDENGNAEATKDYRVEFDAQSYVVTPVLNLGSVGPISTTDGEPTAIDVGTYAISFEDSEVKGTVAASAYKVEAEKVGTSGTAPVIDGNRITIGTYSTVKITVKYPTQSGAEAGSQTFFVKAN